MGFKLKRPFVLICVCSILISLMVLGGAARHQSAFAGFFDDFGIKDELELGRKFDLMVRTQMPLVEDPEVKFYIRALVDRLVAVLPPQPFEFKTDVLLHNSMNAFAVPGGYVFVHTGLIMQLDHESELAGVLAHELAHVTQRHIAHRIDRSRYTTLASVLGALAGAFMGGHGGGALAVGSMAAGQSAMLNYSRLDETEADQIGLQYLVAAGFNPQGLVGSFEKIRKQQWLSGISVPEYLSTHPDVGNRVNEIGARVQSLPAKIRQRKENDAAFNRVKTLLWGRYGAVPQAAQFFAKAPNDPLSIMGQAMLASRKHQINEAKRLFGKAISAAPRESLILREAGIFYYTIGDPQAEPLLLAALKSNPRDLMALFFHARLLDDEGRHREAQKLYQSILRVYPTDAEVHHYLGISFGKSHQLFEGWLHLAYSALYSNDKHRAGELLRKAKEEAKTPEQKKALKTFEEKQRERRSVTEK